jgi:hypothetical protein
MGKEQHEEAYLILRKYCSLTTGFGNTKFLFFTFRSTPGSNSQAAYGSENRTGDNCQTVTEIETGVMQLP